MEHSLHSGAPTAMIRPRGAHRFEVFSPKLSRRLTIYRRVVLDAWVLIVKRNLKLIQLRTQTQLEINAPAHAVISWVLPPSNYVCV